MDDLGLIKDCNNVNLVEGWPIITPLKHALLSSVEMPWLITQSK